MKNNKKLFKFSSLYKKVSEILDQARSHAYKAVNVVMVHAYWSIGELIVEEEQKGKKRANYGKSILDDLSKELTSKYGKGFNVTNLKYFRLFYERFPIRHSLSDELSWTHYRHLLRVENDDTRKFYIDECLKCNWSTRQLERQIDSFYYERILSSKNKKVLKKGTTKKELAAIPEDIIKDPYVLEFLNVSEKSSIREVELESALIEKLQSFLLELGKGFSFVARQKRISSEHNHFYIDLVFYNYILKCFVLIDLKTDKLTHQDVGQMDFYVRYFEDQMKTKDDNPTIGIILCSEKDETIVKYSVLQDSRKLFASKYKLYLPSEKEFKEELEREKQLIKSEKKVLLPPKRKKRK
ncbi:MAG: DUF1016 family protein [Oligoflexia bacterium]|nr:DUF1016 family protein [Oligoflexia bacterium]